MKTCRKFKENMERIEKMTIEKDINIIIKRRQSRKHYKGKYKENIKRIIRKKVDCWLENNEQKVVKKDKK